MEPSAGTVQLILLWDGTPVDETPGARWTQLLQHKIDAERHQNKILSPSTRKDLVRVKSDLNHLRESVIKLRFDIQYWTKACLELPRSSHGLHWDSSRSLHGMHWDYWKNEMDQVMDLWQNLYSFLLRMEQVFLDWEKFLISWKETLLPALFNLLMSRSSEFPNRFRPPCTTMPWTIWPALVVLWGVCWMFYNPLNFDCEALDQNENSGAQLP
ncbi:MAG: hypothetical protein Q9227_001386, partial [Pyrenula ochraceoflavens]